MRYYIELVNEITFTFMLDLSPIFSLLITSDILRYKLGWVFIAFYVGLFAFNLLVIIVPMVNAVRNKCITKLQIRANNRLIEAKAKTKQKKKD